MENKFEIFKIQIPLGGDASNALIYNESRSSQGLILITEELKKSMSGEHKKFFYAAHEKDGELKIWKEAPWQGW